MAKKYDSTVTSLFSGGKLTTTPVVQNSQVNDITQPRSLFANTQPVQQPVTPQYKPVATKPITVADQAQSLIKTVSQSIKGLDVKKIGQSLVSGAKALPGQIEQAGGIILKGLVSQKDASDAFFKPAKKLFGVPEYNIDKQLRQKVLDTSQQLREQGTVKMSKVQEQYAKEKKPSTGFQSLMENVAYNLPQVAASTGLSVATALITKNPALATTIGLSTSYGLGAGEVYNEARKNGQTDKQALPISMAGGVIIGALDFLPLNRLLKSTEAVETVKKSIIKKISQEIVSLATQAGFEGITEGAQEFVGNAIARTYNEHKDLFEGITEAGLVGAILGGVGDVTVNTITGISDAVSSKKIDTVIQKALSTDPQKRTPEQQTIVESLLTKQMSADEAASYVLENNLGRTEYGKQIMLSVLQAKQSDKDIRIVPSLDEKSLNVTLVDKGSDIITDTKQSTAAIEQPAEVTSPEDVGGKTFYHGTAKGNKFTEFDLKKAGEGVGSNIIDQGDQIYLSENEKTANWFSKQVMNKKTGKFDSGEVLPFTFKKGSRMLDIDTMPRLNPDAVEKIIADAKSKGYDAIRFPDRGFDTIEGDPSIAELYNGDTPPKTIIVINKDSIQSGGTSIEGVSTVGEVAQKRIDELKAKQTKPKKDLKIEYASNLSPEGDAIQKRFGQYLEENYDEARRIYKEKFGKVLNTDQARELSIDYAPDGVNEITDANKKARAAHAADVHEPSSSFIKQMFEDDINELLAKGYAPEVLFTAGGTGAGKSTAIENISEIKALQDHADIVYDTNLNGYNSAVKKIDKILSVGGDVVITYVHRDVIDSFINGSLPRAMRMGRTVPVVEHIKTHTDVAPTILKLIEHYKGNPDEVHFRVIDNSLGRNNAKEKNLDFIDEIRYNKDEVKKQLLLALDEQYATGKRTNYKEGINQSVYEGTLGKTSQVTTEGESGSNDGSASKEPQQERRKVGEEPIGASKEKKPSKLYERVKETLGDEYASQEKKYNVLDLEKQAEQVTSLIESDPERSARIAYGLEEAPQGMTRNAMSVGLAEVARSKGDWKTAAKLWTKTSLRSTRYGQEIVSLRGNLTETNPLNYVKRVLGGRLDAIAKNYKSLLEGLDVAENATPQQKAVAVIKKKTEQLKEQLMKRKKDFKTAQSIIDALRC